ncbi:glucose-6-phosphate isomerase [Halioxenophilus sp. WMMB6]|uniref:glucose-6-phosphate isomerase n=1 Tax=Halioxenophilus sp. WMMB6 TaxID=3073815 RepID=UPI00295E7CEF|nr:glucose-6-phosphate isomerase [Halioxenophilus sp. WMMB6]
MSNKERYPYPSWPQLYTHSQQLPTLVSLLAEDPDRVDHFSLEVGPLYLDYSKCHLDAPARDALWQLAEEAGLPAAIQRLLAGEHVNNTEQRPALHTALRSPSLSADDKNTIVAQTQAKVAEFVERLHTGAWLGYTGRAITDVVNIGIGGSDLGPRMVVTALSNYQAARPRVHFVANIDGADLSDQIANLNPETTLFIVASKSFSTLETRENALAARQWLQDSGCSQALLCQHFVAVSSNVPTAVEFGISEDNIFPMWDWVGGRYSLWSAIGLPIAIALGMKQFKELLAGAELMDTHFSQAPMAANMPVTLALLTFWYSAALNYQSQAILPYAQRLSRLPAYLQQLDMESLGKSVTVSGAPLADDSGLILWGTEGTNGQHSFHQLLHQGTRKVLVDFIACAQPMSVLDNHHTYLLANCIGQGQALLAGKSLAEAKAELLSAGKSPDEADRLAPHKVIPGNRPSNTLILDQLNPHSLGALIALYEHKVYCLGVLWNLNPFDQWGVELGKQLGAAVYPALTGQAIPETWDASTRALTERLQSNKQ